MTTTTNADKRALSRLLFGLVICTLLTGATALSVLGMSGSTKAVAGYATAIDIADNH